MRKAQRAGIWLVYIPSQLTFLLQPLDTHGFASFKAWLKQRYKELQSKSEDGIVDRLHWLQVLQSAKGQFFDIRQWARSFSDTGASRPCVHLTAALNRHVQPETARNAPVHEPTTQDLTVVWLRRPKMLYAHELLFRATAAACDSKHGCEGTKCKEVVSRASNEHSA